MEFELFGISLRKVDYAHLTREACVFTAQSAPVQPPRSYVPVNNTKDNPPCNTLFIGNLSESTNEDELRGLFVGQPGFRQLKLVRGARSVTCFVEFSDVASAMGVHQSQQVR